MDFSEETATEAVQASFAGAPDQRLRQVLASLVAHLHGFVREVEPTMAEWEQAIRFLTATGQRSDDQRQEFILLSDVLGVTMLVDAINHRNASAATESTVLGPFHQVASPRRELGDSIDLVGTGEPCVVEGRVTSLDGTPLAGAQVDVWQADDHGFYDVQQPQTQPPGNGRGLFTCGDDGRFWFRTVTPSPYPIPTDGPVGALLEAAGRHPWRPAHIHLLVAAGGHLPVTTHVFVADSPYLDSDAVFAVKQTLVREFARVEDPARAAGYGVAAPFRHARFDVVLQPAPGRDPATDRAARTPP